jgi:hypothetical protein
MDSHFRFSALLYSDDRSETSSGAMRCGMQEFIDGMKAVYGITIVCTLYVKLDMGFEGSDTPWF